MEIIYLLFIIMVGCLVATKLLLQKPSMPYTVGQKYRKGLIVRMNVASRSHVKRPYFVRIDFYNENATNAGETKMITSIPNEHSCKMTVNSNWEYHEPRMEIVGDEKEFGHLLYNQKLI
jgi:hypothetical protein